MALFFLIQLPVDERYYFLPRRSTMELSGGDLVRRLRELIHRAVASARRGHRRVETGDRGDETPRYVVIFLSSGGIYTVYKMRIPPPRVGVVHEFSIKFPGGITEI